MKDFREYIIDRGVVTAEQLGAVSAKNSSNEPIYYQLLRKFPELEEPIWQVLADFLQITLVNPQEIDLNPQLTHLLPAQMAHEFSIVPLSQHGQKVEVAMADPQQFEKCEEFSMLLMREGRSKKLFQGQEGQSKKLFQGQEGQNEKLFQRQEGAGGKQSQSWEGTGKKQSQEREGAGRKQYQEQEGTDKDRFQDTLVVEGRLALPSDIAKMIRELYGIGAETVQEIIDEQIVPEIMILGPEVVDLTKQEEEGEDAAIVRFVNQLLLEAVKNEASDIHLEPYEKDLRIRYRLDGMLQTEPVPEKIKHLEAAIISRIKIMANLDIAEKRLPQDGQIRLLVMGRPIDVRVSVLPTMFGQGLALRLLDRQVVFRRLDNLGMPQEYLKLYRSVLTLSHGVVLVTGPTGSGKTTTLYGSLNEINSEDRKIITVEDPIEYQMEGITQIQVKPQIDLTFANILRNILRHDPDVIMVGEIRDRSTAQIAISAAMTGHLVFSTLHTNDAPSAPVRLLEMGVEPYLVSSALEAVAAQRLIRVLCTECRQQVDPSKITTGEDRNGLAQEPIYKSNGCPECRYSGYKGRTAIFELFTLNDKIRQMILNRQDAEQIRKEAQTLGMRTLHQSGIEKVKQGLSSLAEVYRVAREESM